MHIYTFQNKWDYELIDSGNGKRLERWGKYILSRPDPQAIWTPHAHENEWLASDAIFDSKWHIRTNVTQPWTVTWPLPLGPKQAVTGNWDLNLIARLSSFKHTGVFAEQAANWEWLAEQTQNGKWKVKNEKPRILNLFGYTGAATVLLAKLGCFVTHVDASKPTIGWAKENQAANRLPEDSIRWILDDCVKFVKREVKRGALYDGIILDPPAYGHTPGGQTWKFGEGLPDLLSLCDQLLSPTAKFILVNAYATNTSSIALQNVLEDTIKKTRTTIEVGELCLEQRDHRILSTGIVARCSR